MLATGKNGPENCRRTRALRPGPVTKWSGNQVVLMVRGVYEEALTGAPVVHQCPTLALIHQANSHRKSPNEQPSTADPRWTTIVKHLAPTPAPMFSDAD